MITVVIPTYNVEKYIGRAIESVLAQTHDDWELIIVDDCSIDRTAEIVIGYASRFPKIRLVKRKENSGGARLPRYQGILEAKGEYVSPIDADDFIEPEYLSKMIRRMTETSVDVVLSLLQYCDENEVEDERSIPKLPFDFDKIVTGREACIETIGGWKINMAGLLMKSSIYKNFISNEIENDCSSCFNDELDYRKLLLSVDKVAFSDAKYYYRQQGGSVVHLLRSQYVDRINQIQPLYDLVKKHFSADIVIMNNMNHEYAQLLYVAMSTLFQDKRTMTKEDYDRHYSQIAESHAYFGKESCDFASMKMRMIHKSFIALCCLARLRNLYISIKTR